MQLNIKDDETAVIKSTIFVQFVVYHMCTQHDICVFSHSEKIFEWVFRSDANKKKLMFKYHISSLFAK